MVLLVLTGVGAWFAISSGDDEGGRANAEAEAGKGDPSPSDPDGEGADDRTWVTVTDEASGLTWSMPEHDPAEPSSYAPIGVDGQGTKYRSIEGDLYVSVSVWPKGDPAGLPGILNTLTEVASGHPFEQEMTKVNGRPVAKADVLLSEGSGAMAAVAVVEIDGAMVAVQTTMATAEGLDRDGVDRIVESLSPA